jgi:ABC-type branched-subunit amino acid transport system substrate-binding protein
MLSVLAFARKSLVRFVFGAAVLGLAACTTGPLTPGPGPSSGGSGAVAVALLVPGGSGQASDELLARSLQNAARLAIADLNGVTIDLRVYNTAGQPGQARVMALQAVDEGAQIILGPVFAQEANAAGVAVAGRGVNLLSFSNNPDIAGGNVFVLGPTFQNTAGRLASYAARNGRGRMMVVHDRNTAGELGRAAVERGVAQAGGTVVGIGSYEFSQNGVVNAAPGIVATAKSSGANAVFLTADTAGALPLVTQLLRDNGLDTEAMRLIGLTRWDIPAATLALPGVQGGWFALPDPNLYAQYQARYQAAYGEAPHPISGLAYDGIAAIGALARRGQTGPIPAADLTQGAGFVGVNGVFRLRGDGTNERGLAVAQVRNNQVVVIDPAPRSFGGAGF